MRVAKLSRTLLLLALPVVPVACALAQDHPNVQPSAVRDKLMKQGPGTAQPQAAAPKPAAAPAKAPAAKSPAQAPAKASSQPKAQTPATAAKAPAPAKAQTKAPAQPLVKAPAKAQAKAPAKAPEKAESQKPAKPAVEKPAEEKVSVTRRDPFDALLNKTRPANGTPENLPPGKAGLMVGTLRIQGIVNGSGGTIAIVSNPQQRVYFLREGDKLYDGSVEHITLEAITFQEFGKDAFGKPLERQVTRRLYPSPGEQQ